MEDLLSTNLGQLSYKKHLEWKEIIANEKKNPGTAWEGEYPPSSILGPALSKMSSGSLGVLSLIFLAVGQWAVNSLIELPGPWGTSENDKLLATYLLALQFFPISWGTHVAAWIQKQNGK